MATLPAEAGSLQVPATCFAGGRNPARHETELIPSEITGDEGLPKQIEGRGEQAWSVPLD